MPGNTEIGTLDLTRESSLPWRERACMRTATIVWTILSTGDPRGLDVNMRLGPWEYPRGHAERMVNEVQTAVREVLAAALTSESDLEAAGTDTPLRQRIGRYSRERTWRQKSYCYPPMGRATSWPSWKQQRHCYEPELTWSVTVVCQRRRGESARRDCGRTAYQCETSSS